MLFIVLLASILYSQNVVSLNEGNQWYYKYDYWTNALNNGSTYLDYMLKKEVVGDTLLPDGDYKKIKVTKIDNGVSSFDSYEYWYCDSLEFKVVGNDLLYNFPKIFDLRLDKDSIGVDYFSSSGDTTILGENVLLQVFFYQQWGMAQISTKVSTAQNIGITNINQDGHVDTAELDWTYDISLIGAYIDGKEIGNINSVAKNKEFINFVLKQNYPNPFNPSTTIQYSIPKESFVTIKVYNVLGKEIVTLVNERKSAGTYSVNFNSSNISSGVYFYRLISGTHSATKKMVILK